MSDLYGEFDDSDDLEGNDDEEIGALGSILSWDDDEDHAVRTSDPDVAAALGGKSVMPTMPPGLVSFSLAKDANGQLYFPQLGGNNNMNANNGNNNNSNNNNQMLDTGGVGNTGQPTDANVAMNMPLPTPINFAQEQQQQQGSGDNQSSNCGSNDQKQTQQTFTQANSQQQQQQQQQPQIMIQGNQVVQQLLPAHFALFQQQLQQQQQQISLRPAQGMAGLILPQVGQQQGQQQQLQPAQQQQVPPVQQQQMQPQMQQQMQPQMQQQMQSQMQQQQVQQQLQQQAAQQFSITGDANAFLRQLQVAQIQQQFNALQQQQQQQQQQGGITQSSINTAQQQAVLQQQLQQLQRAQMPMVAVQQAPQQQQQQQLAAVLPPAGVAAATGPVGLPPKPKAAPKTSGTKTKAAGSRKKAPPSAAGIVSASDTDGELSNRGAKRSSAATDTDTSTGGGGSKKRKPPEPIDLSHLSPPERAKANRDRNREHARNTRLRKKAYLEKLKTTVDELCKERDTLVSERAGAANLLVEMHNTRTEVLMSFFALRSTNEKRRKLWASILDESCFACVMPVTPYRSFPASEVQVSKCQRTVLGIDGMMADTASLHVLLSSLVDRAKFPHGKIEFCYTLVTEEAVVAGNQMMARWVMTTLNAVQCGARMEVSKQGMLCCKFNSAHRITGLELMFDVMALMLQLKQAAGSESFSVIPNTVQTCQRAFDKPMVMTLAEGPYTIVQVNQLWENMTGYKAEEVVGKTSCSILQGSQTDKSALHEMMSEVRFKRAASAMFVNYTKSGERFRNCIVVFPLSTDSRITHYLALTSYVERLPADGSDSNAAAVVVQPIAASSAGGFNAGASAAAAGQMHQMLQSQAQAIQGNAAAAAQHQAALAKAASAALMAQNELIAGSEPNGLQGQMLPPPNNIMNVQQHFPPQNLPQQATGAAASQQAQV